MPPLFFMLSFSRDAVCRALAPLVLNRVKTLPATYIVYILFLYCSYIVDIRTICEQYVNNIRTI